MSKLSNLTLWEALGKYSNEALWDEYLSHRARSVGGVGAFARLTDKMKDNKPSIQEFFQGFQKANWESSNDQNKTKELFNTLISDFKLKFDSNKLYAYGYSIPRKAEDKPKLIPFDVITEGTINWNDSSVIGNGLEFVGVTVLEERLVNELNETINLNSNERELIDKPKKGKSRPSLNDLIKEIYLLEKKSGNIDFYLSKKKIYEGLEITIAEREDISFSEEKGHFDGLGYTAINNSIGSLVDKEKNKLSS